MQWPQAGAVLIEAIKQSQWSGDAKGVAVLFDECLLTRGGAVVLVGDTARAAPEALVALLDDLLSVSADPDRLGVAQDSGQAVTFLREVAERTSPQRRRIEIASLALRALAAQADRDLRTPRRPRSRLAAVRGNDAVRDSTAVSRGANRGSTGGRFHAVRRSTTSGHCVAANAATGSSEGAWPAPGDGPSMAEGGDGPRGGGGGGRTTTAPGPSAGTAPAPRDSPTGLADP